MAGESYTDEVLVLQVKNWQTADKQAVCLSREHGKIVCMAYGARYAKSAVGRLLQPFACLQAEFLLALCRFLVGMKCILPDARRSAATFLCRRNIKIRQKKDRRFFECW